MQKISKNFLSGIFNDKMFYQSLFRIALPIIIQNFIASSLNMVDTVMVGKLGEAEIAAVGIANQFFILFSLAAMGIHSGCGIFISQFWGKKDENNIRKVLSVGLAASAGVAAVFMIIAIVFSSNIIAIFNEDPLVISLGGKYLRIVCISYIFTAVSFGYSFASRCIGETLLPMLVSAGSLLCNTVLNYMFIFGKFGSPAMGVEGAALATVIARIVEFLMLVGYIYGKRGVLAAKISNLRDATDEFLIKIFKTVLPVVLNEACWALGFVVYSVAYGRISTQAIAAVQICGTIQNLFTVAIFGMANASAVMIGNKIGAGEEDTGKVYAGRFSILGCMTGLLLGLLMVLLARPIVAFFDVSEIVMQSSLKILYIFAATLVVRVFNIILIVGILRGGGDAKFSLIAEGFTMWFIGVPLAFMGAFLFKLPVYLVVALVTVEEMVKAVIGFYRLVSNRWVRNVIHNM